MKSRGWKVIVPDGTRRRIRNGSLYLGLALLFGVVIPDGLTAGNRYVGGRDTFLAVCVLCFACFVIWLLATDAVWSRLPRRRVAPSFPAARIAIRDALTMSLHEVDDTEPTDSALLIYHLEVTNRQTDRPMHLVFRLRVRNEKRPGHALDLNLPLFHSKNPAQEENISIKLPLDVGPLDHFTGYLGFRDLILRWIAYDGFRFSPSEGCRLIMSVEDYDSGGKIEFDVPGTWES
jgi:hypothetical protein